MQSAGNSKGSGSSGQGNRGGQQEPRRPWFGRCPTAAQMALEANATTYYVNVNGMFSEPSTEGLLEFKMVKYNTLVEDTMEEEEEAGAAGVAGVAVANGATGAAGAAGVAVANGATGAAGAAVATVATGATGITGATGGEGQGQEVMEVDDSLRGMKLSRKRKQDDTMGSNEDLPGYSMEDTSPPSQPETWTWESVPPIGRVTLRRGRRRGEQSTASASAGASGGPAQGPSDEAGAVGGHQCDGGCSCNYARSLLGLATFPTPMTEAELINSYRGGV